MQPSVQSASVSIKMEIKSVGRITRVATIISTLNAELRGLPSIPSVQCAVQNTWLTLKRHRVTKSRARRPPQQHRNSHYLPLLKIQSLRHLEIRTPLLRTYKRKETNKTRCQMYDEKLFQRDSQDELVPMKIVPDTLFRGLHAVYEWAMIFT